MFLVYNLLALFLSPLILPALALACLREKYRARIPARLGVGLARRLGPDAGASVIWIHALSVGEVTSAGPLLRGLRERWPEAVLVLSVTTRTGERLARERYAGICRAIVAAPYDLPAVIRHFIACIRPRLFIQVETDFWPGWLSQLARAGVPAYLVNGRITEKSLARYRRFAWFFAPMFDCFRGLCMQTAADAANMAGLGLAPEKMHVLGNLKFDASETTEPPGPDVRRELRRRYGFADDAPLLLCGSTHPGEEALLLPAVATILRDMPQLQLLLAPRRIERADEIVALAERSGIVFRRRSLMAGTAETGGPFLVLDTLGELAGCYALADLAFIGGSLAPCGGHNPVEATAAGTPVCFGPHMEDFSEIAADLVEAGGAVRLTVEGLARALRDLLADAPRRAAMGRAGLDWLAGQRGVVERHLALIAPHLDS